MSAFSLYECRDSCSVFCYAVFSFLVIFLVETSVTVCEITLCCSTEDHCLWPGRGCSWLSAVPVARCSNSPSHCNTSASISCPVQYSPLLSFAIACSKLSTASSYETWRVILLANHSVIISCSIVLWNWSGKRKEMFAWATFGFAPFRVWYFLLTKWRLLGTVLIALLWGQHFNCRHCVLH